MKKNSLGASQRIKSQKIVDKIFEKSALSTSVFPFAIRYYIEKNTESTSSVLVGFSVSKRHYKKAVDRNKIKRWMREAYRKNKEILYPISETHKISIYLFLILQKPLTSIDYHDVEARIVKLMERVGKEFG